MAGPSQAVVKMSKVITHRVALSKALVERAGYSVEAFERVCLNMLMTSPDLAKCDEDSVNRAIMTCVELGIQPDGRECAVVPMGKTATVMPMIKGELKLARIATPGLALRVRVVYDGDDFTHREGLDATIEHIPNPRTQRTPDNVIAAYAVGQMPGAEWPEFEVLYREDLDRYRRRSAAVKAGRKGPWDNDYAEMCKKSVLRQLLKRLPQVPGMPEPDDPEVDVDGLTPVYDGPPAGELDVPAAPVETAEVVEAEATEKPKPKQRTTTKRGSRSKAKDEPKPDPKAEQKPEPDEASTSTEDQPSTNGGESAVSPEDEAIEKMANDQIDAPF